MYDVIYTYLGGLQTSLGNTKPLSRWRQCECSDALRLWQSTNQLLVLGLGVVEDYTMAAWINCCGLVAVVDRRRDVSFEAEGVPRAEDGGVGHAHATRAVSLATRPRCGATAWLLSVGGRRLVAAGVRAVRVPPRGLTMTLPRLALCPGQPVTGITPRWAAKADPLLGAKLPAPHAGSVRVRSTTPRGGRRTARVPPGGVGAGGLMPRFARPPRGPRRRSPLDAFLGWL